MIRSSLRYWESAASKADSETRDAILAGFRSAKSFDEAGREDAEHLVLPFIDPRSVVVDVGCGMGRILKWVVPHCAKAYGLDLAKGMLRKAKQHLDGASNVFFQQIPLSLELPLPNACADFIYFYHVSEHMDREDAFKILAGVKRCLRRRGRALVQFSLVAHLDNRQEFLKWVKAGDPEGVRSRFYSEEEVNILLDMVGLHPQLRLYIPGEMVLIVTKSRNRVLGQMPLIKLRSAR